MKRTVASSRLFQFLADESGPTATEYAVMLALIIAVCIGTVSAFGLSVKDSVFNSVNAVF